MLLQLLFLVVALAAIVSSVQSYLVRKSVTSSLVSLAVKHEAFLRDALEQAITRTIDAAKNHGQLSRLCAECKRVVHAYNEFESGKILCKDCQVKK